MTQPIQLTVRTLNGLKDYEEARQLAIDWQLWACDQDLTYGELLDAQQFFTRVAEIFHLHKEFRENGII